MSAGSNAPAHRMVTARSPEALLLDYAATRMLKQAPENLSAQFRDANVQRELEGMSYKASREHSGIFVR